MPKWPSYKRLAAAGNWVTPKSTPNKAPYLEEPENDSSDTTNQVEAKNEQFVKKSKKIEVKTEHTQQLSGESTDQT